MDTKTILEGIILIEIELQQIKHNKQTKILKAKIMKLEQEKYDLELDNARYANYSRNVGLGIFCGLLVGLTLGSLIMYLI